MLRAFWALLLVATIIWQAQCQYINEFAVRLTPSARASVNDVVAQHGFRVKRELPNINVFILEHPEVEHRHKRSATNHLQRLLNDERIEHAQQEEALVRVKRRILYDKQLELPIREISDDSAYHRVPVLQQRDDVYGSDASLRYNDPKFGDMWYLFNKGQSGGERGMDMNVGKVWEAGFTGKGVVVCILDDGVDHTHPDLKYNYDPKASCDLNDKSDKKGDPMPDTSNIENSHGTRCAGEIAAAANNGVCGVGVAYDCKIGGARILDGVVTDSLEAEALSFNRQYIHIYSASWGPSDDGKTMEGPRKFSLEALVEGVKKGRGGLGSIFVWATGNGGMFKDCCSADGYVSRPETLSVGSVNDFGRSPFFMENCSSTLSTVPSGGDDYVGQTYPGGVKLKVVTDDFKGGCIENFQGTSSAAPLAAGCIANVLQANPQLTWRDVQHVVVRGSRIPSADTSWTINGAGHHVSHKFGFGVMDCGKMVHLAQTWESLPERRTCQASFREVNRQLPPGGAMSESVFTTACEGTDDAIDRIEHVQVHVNMTSKRRGNIRISLTSPANTRSILLSTREKDNHNGQWDFTFMTVHSWDESPRGKWTLDVEDSGAAGDKDSEPAGVVYTWSLVFHGTHGTRHARDRLQANREQRAYRPTADKVLQIKKREVKLSKTVKVKRSEDLEKKDAENDALVKALMGQEDRDVTEARRGQMEAEAAGELYRLLHDHGARAVRKRKLETPTSRRAEVAEDTDIDRLLMELTRALSRREQKSRF